MASGNLSILAKNLKSFVPAMVSLGASVSTNMATYKKIKDRQWLHAPQDHKDQAEVWDTQYWKRHLSQHKNMWVDKELSTEVSQKELANFITFKHDMWKMYHCAGPLFLVGGWAIPFWSLWLGNYTWLPSTFGQGENAAAWREAQDLYRYKYVPGCLADIRWFMEHHIKLPDWYWPAWEELFEKNDVKRHGAKVGEVLRQYDQFQPFHLIRRKQIRAMARAMGIPTFPAFGKINIQARVKDVWELLWNEDHMVIAGKLHETMSDEELQDYAWRRFLSPYDKKLNREQILERVVDYHQFLGKKFVEEGQAPNIFVTNAYVMGYYNDPAFLDMDIAELEKDDFEHLAAWGKDAFLQRLEFENGPLRDQVEAHSLKKLAEREKLLAS